MPDPLGPPAGRSLPLLAHRNGKRTAMTCLYRCENQCAHPDPNTSDNPSFGEVVAGAMSRRGFLKAGAAAAFVVSGVGLAADPAAAQTPVRAGRPRVGDAGPATGALTFTPVSPNTLDDVVVPNGYAYNVVARWGDPLLPGAPPFEFERQTAAAQEQQFGYNCDYVTILPLAGRYRGGDRALLVVNHEYTNPELMFRDYDRDGSTERDLEHARIELAAHGMAVVEIFRERDRGAWHMVPRSRYNRRVTALSTELELRGPAAGHPLLRTGADPTGTRVIGTLNNCAGGTTPWGTVLSGEENWHGYFVNAATVADEAEQAIHRRYGVTQGPRNSRGLHRVAPRLDLVVEPHEPFRFGWVVELDPYDPDSRPIKRTALGRMKHENAECAVSNVGHAVTYMGDDQQFEYIYKFVSRQTISNGRSRRDRQHNLGLLDDGTLYVARFDGDSPASEIDGSGALPSDGAFDGTGRWIPLVSGTTSHVPGWTAAEVLINTRGAADQVGATKMDRPEDIERNPVNGRVYAALTNNTNRGAAQVDEANPRATNRYGHVIELSEAGDDAAATSFTWRIFLICGDPDDPSTYFGGFDKSQVSPISCPDNVAFDARGNLWIGTDGAPGTIGQNDGFFVTPVEGPDRGHVRQYLSVPREAEACGPILSRDNQTMFCAVQHPGEAGGASPDNRVSTWPDGGQPRPSVVATFRTAPGPRHIGA